MVGGKIKNTCLVIEEKTALVKMVGFYNLCEIIVSSVDVWFMIKRAAYAVLHVFFTFYPFFCFYCLLIKHIDSGNPVVDAQHYYI